MNPFSKKKRNQSLYDILTPEELAELKESTTIEKPLSPYVLTKDEIEHEEETDHVCDIVVGNDSKCEGDAVHTRLVAAQEQLKSEHDKRQQNKWV